MAQKLIQTRQTQLTQTTQARRVAEREETNPRSVGLSLSPQENAVLTTSDRFPLKQTGANRKRELWQQKRLLSSSCFVGSSSQFRHTSWRNIPPTLRLEGWGVPQFHASSLPHKGENGTINGDLQGSPGQPPPPIPFTTSRGWRNKRSSSGCVCKPATILPSKGSPALFNACRS